MPQTIKLQKRDDLSMGDILVTKDVSDWFKSHIFDCSEFKGYIQLASKRCFKYFAPYLRSKGITVEYILKMKTKSEIKKACSDLVPGEFDSILSYEFSVSLRGYNFKYEDYIFLGDFDSNLELYTRPGKDENRALIATKAESKNLTEPGYDAKRFDEFVKIRKAIDFDKFKFDKATPALLA